MALFNWLSRIFNRLPPADPPRAGGGGASASWEPAQPRGIRNRNPGNIRGSKVAWKGETGRDSQDFCIFVSPHYGLRAIAKLLITYRFQHGLDCVEEIIGRWAPRSENNTRAYIDAVARELGVPPMMTLDMLAPDVLARFIAAIVRHENGRQPYPMTEIHAAVADALDGI